MLPQHLHLLLAALLWLFLHIGISGTPLRGVLVARVGAGGFQVAYSTLSAGSLGLLIWTYGRASNPETFYGLWVIEAWMYWVPFLAMPVALLFFIGAVTVKNPTAVGAERALDDADAARGILRITRHPMLWAFALWALAHLFANGDLASAVLFLTIAITAFAGMPSIDAKRRASDPRGWATYAARTSIIPFVAIAAGRNRLALGEIGLWRPALAIFVWIALMHAHPFVIGVSAMPF